MKESRGIFWPCHVMVVLVPFRCQCFHLPSLRLVGLPPRLFVSCCFALLHGDCKKVVALAEFTRNECLLFVLENVKLQRFVISLTASRECLLPMYPTSSIKVMVARVKYPPRPRFLGT